MTHPQSHSFKHGWWTKCRANRRSLTVLLMIVAVTGCSQRDASRRGPRNLPQAVQKTEGIQRERGTLIAPIELPQPAQRLGTAVVVLVDTSGSMSQTVSDQSGRQRPKNEIARESLMRIIQVTDDWHKQHPESPLFLGLASFSSVCANTLPIREFDASAAKTALARIPSPSGGTAIGLAIEQGFKRLYETGCVRKHLVCITDGQNTVATPPNLMAKQLYAQTKGDVEIHFVAFDTAASHFAFLKDVNGSVVEAADGAQLQDRLVELYEKRILAEAMPAEKQ